MRRVVTAYTRDRSATYREREARIERREDRCERRARFGSYGSPLDNVRWEGSWVGDCPNCGTRCVIGVGPKLEGILPVECPNEACWYSEHYNYREAIDG